MMNSRSLTLAVLLVGLAGGRATADLVDGGGSGAYNNFPFGATGLYQGEYQQVYSSSIFSSVSEITSVAFETDDTRGDGGSGVTGTITFSIGLSTTGASVSAPSTDYAANKGADFTTVFSGTVTYTALKNGTFDLVIPTSSFLYDPTRGNLLLDLEITSVSNAGGNIPFVGGNTPLASRVYNSGGTGAPTADGFSLATQFSAQAVPEPSSIALVCVGAPAALWVMTRRRKGGRS